MLMLLAQTETTGVYHRFARLLSMSEWWQWLLLLLIVAVVIGYVIFMYRRDAVELAKGTALLLVFLRLAAFGGILFYFLDLEKGTERRLVKNSRAVVMVDVSQSMALTDSAAATSASESRSDRVVQAFTEGGFLEELRQQHDVLVYRFGENPKPTQVAALPRVPRAEEEGDATREEVLQRAVGQSRTIAGIAAGFLAVSLVSGIVALLFRGFPAAPGSERTSWSLLVSIVALIVAVVVLAVANLRHPEIGWRTVVGLREAEVVEETSEDENQPPPITAASINWQEQLSPRDLETRLGDALRTLVNEERGGPISGVVLISDGRNNAGMEYEAALVTAQDADLPIFTIGVGASERPANARVVDLEAPQRVYPGDDFNLKGYVQAFGLAGRTISVQLYSGAGDEEAMALEDEVRITLGNDGESIPVAFTTSPTDQGRRVYKLQLVAPSEDTDANDNARTASVEVVDEKNRVLLIAGGPTREYRFLRNMLFRDKDTKIDVLLQTAEPGVSQESDEVIFEFPTVADELFEYDCIVAFDPDWEKLDELQVALLDRWVAENAGGLILVAGPVFTPEWTRIRRGTDRRIDTIRSLYPVVFLNQSSASLRLGRTGGDIPWPLQFTRDGQESRFLWLEDEAIENEKAWAAFEGVYGYYAVRDRKEGARVFARFSDPQEASLDNEQPIYMAGHYYGAGRVFFLASGELWRLRAVEPGYFETFYTNLIRWASEGRLLRDSTRGVLLVDKERCFLRDQIGVTAILTDAQHQPLQAAEVVASVVEPGGVRKSITLRAVQDAARAGTFVGQFTPLREGDYMVELAPLGGDDLLTREVRARVPELETEQPSRNDPLLRDLADATGGKYFIGLQDGLDTQRAEAIPRLLSPNDQVTRLPGRPDRKFEELLMTWLMALICGVLSLEWVIRRLSKLA